LNEKELLTVLTTKKAKTVLESWKWWTTKRRKYKRASS